MKAGEAVRVMGDIIPAQIWGLRGRLRVLSHDDHRVGRDPLQVGESARICRSRCAPPNHRTFEQMPTTCACPTISAHARPSRHVTGRWGAIGKSFAPVDMSGVRICQQVSRALLLP